MQPHARSGAGALLAALLLATPLAAQTQWDWRGQVAPGRTLEIRGVNGAIHASAATGSEARVSAVKTGRRSDPGEVRIEVVEHAGGVTICAIYPTPSGERPNECRPGGGRHSSRNNDVQVAFTVAVPAGVNLAAHTVNGSIDIEGVTAHADARSVNGSVRVSTRGTANARTVNGTIDATIGRTDWQDALSFETVNGAVNVIVAGELNARVKASTVNGQIRTDYPLTVEGRWGPRSIDGTVGTGGRALELKTVNGAIALRRQ